MDKPAYDFNRPMTFLNALESFTLALGCVMVALRDEAAFRDEPDQATLNAVFMLCAMLEDSYREAVVLTKIIDQRLLANTN